MDNYIFEKKKSRWTPLLIYILAVACFTVVIVAIGKVVDSKATTPKNYVLSCADVYEDNLILSDACVTTKNGTHIEVVFVQKHDVLSGDIICEVYTALYEKFFEAPESAYTNYDMTIYFNLVENFFTNKIENMSKNNSELKLYILNSDVSINLNQIVAAMPEIKELYWFTTADIGDISAMSDFYGLMLFECYAALTDEDIEYIQSLYPECDVQCEDIEFRRPNYTEYSRYVKIITNY